MSLVTDQNLLFGILALQMDFISREQLITGMQAWILAKDEPLAKHLVQSGALRSEHRQLLEPLVEAHIRQHDNDPAKSLASMVSVGSVKQELHELGDAALAASVAQVSAARNQDCDPNATASWSVGASTSQGERFRILRPHAQGGLGKVSVARDEELHREVALKEIRPEYADDLERRARFTLEAEITGGLEHPGIVPVYGLGSYLDGRPFYAMRFIKGDSLKEAIERFHQADKTSHRDAAARSLELRKLLGRFIDVCHAIEYAHSRGVLHRDLKPGNIMLGKYGETLVVDWGLAKVKGRTEHLPDLVSEVVLQPVSGSEVEPTQMGAMIGTLQYMSPEQANGRLDMLGPATDVYSLGATLFTLLTGKPPLLGSNREELLQNAQSGRFPRPRELKKEIPPPLEAICLKGMAKEPKQRYATPLELVDDLEHWLADEPVNAQKESLIDRVTRLGRRHRSLVLAIGIALVLISVISLVAGIIVDQKRREAEGLAAEKGKLADEKAGLAQRNAKLAEEKGNLALKEKEARQEIEKQLRLATALRLAALSGDIRGEFPVKSTLLAIEAHHAVQTNHEQGGALEVAADNALRESLRTIGGYPLWGHSGSIDTMSMSPDGRWLATGDGMGQIRVWDLAADNPQAAAKVLRGDVSGINRSTISPDGHWLVAVCNDGSARLWNLTAADPNIDVRVLRGEHGVVCIAITPDSHWLTTGSSDGTVQVWDLTAKNPGTVHQLLRGHQARVLCLSTSPNSQWLVSGSEDKTIRIWDLAAADPDKTAKSLQGHEEAITSLAISPNGRWLASGSHDSSVRVWDLTVDNSEAMVKVLRKHRTQVHCLAISPDGHWLASGSADNTACVYDLTAADLSSTAKVLRAHEGQISCLAISPDSHWLVTGSYDKTARVWDLLSEDPGSSPRVLRGHDSWVNCLVISPKGGLLVTGSWDRSARVWELNNSDPVITPRTLPGNNAESVGSLAASQDGRWLITKGYGSVRVWDLKTADPARPRVILEHGLARCLTTSPDSRWLISGGHDNIVRIWDLTAADLAESVKELRGHSSPINCVAVSPDNKWLVSGGAETDNNSVRVWNLTEADPATTAKVLRGHVGTLTCLAISPDSQWLVTGSTDKSARLWNLIATDPSSTVKVLSGHEDGIRCAAISPDGRWLATGGGDASPRIWDLKAPNPGATAIVLHGHAESITCLGFSPDGAWLATGSEDSTAAVWNLRQTDPEIGRIVLRGHDDVVECLDISRDGRWLVTGSDDSTARLWDLHAADPRSSARVIRGHNDIIACLAISADGHWLATGSNDGTVRLSPLIAADLADLARQHAGRELSKAERETFGATQSPPVASEAPLRGPISLPPMFTHSPFGKNWSSTTWQEREFADAMIRGDWTTAAFHANKLLQQQPAVARHWHRQATVEAQRAHWPAAISSYQAALEREPANTQWPYEMAVACIADKQTDTYKKVVRQWANPLPQDPRTADRILYATLFVRDSLSDPKQYLALAEVVVAKLGKRGSRLKGAALFRNQNFTEALSAFSENPYPMRAWDHFFVAMAQHQIGKTDDAKKSYEAGIAWMKILDDPLMRPFWWERIESETLRQEAAEVLGILPATKKSAASG